MVAPYIESPECEAKIGALSCGGMYYQSLAQLTNFIVVVRVQLVSESGM